MVKVEKLPLAEDLQQLGLKTGCWKWVGSRNGNGYGNFYWNGRLRNAHRFAYEHFVGLIPEGLEPDHLCRNRWCVNFEHLEPVTHKENSLRGKSFAAVNAVKTHCPKGHPLSGDNLKINSVTGGRQCGICHNDSNLRSSKRLRALKVPPHPPTQQFCKNGHEMTNSNSVWSGGKWNCRICRAARRRRYRHRLANGLIA